MPGLSKTRLHSDRFDRDRHAIATARALTRGPSYVNADIRYYRPECDAFDLAISISQSFGYFDATTHRDLLAPLAVAVREDGRVILDLWSCEFFWSSPPSISSRTLNRMTANIDRS